MSTIDGRLARILDKQGREFHLRLKPTRDSANAIFYTNVGKCETQGRIQEESATSTAGVLTGYVTAKQETDAGDALVIVKDRRQSGGWLVLISVSPLLCKDDKQISAPLHNLH